MMIFGWTKVRPYERGLVFRDGELVRVLAPGHRFVASAWNPLVRVRIDRRSVRALWLEHPDLEVIARSGLLGDEARVLDLEAHQRAVVWSNGRVQAVLGPGLRVLWTVFHRVEVQVFDARDVRFDHRDAAVIAEAPGALEYLETWEIAAGSVGLLYRDGRLAGTLQPGVHAFWRGEETLRVAHLDLREQVLDVQGQEIMTADKVTLRLNALAVYRVVDPEKAAEAALVTRREETAAMRSQANTAKIFESNPTLMKLRERRA